MVITKTHVAIKDLKRGWFELRYATSKKYRPDFEDLL